MNSANDHNFFRIPAQSGNPAWSDGPKGYRRGMNCPYRLPCLPGEAYNWCLNIPFTGGVPGSVQLVYPDGSPHQIGSVSTCTLEGGTYLYGTYTIPADTPEGNHTIMLNGYLEGVPVRVVRDPIVEQYTALISILSPDAAFGYPFPALPEGFRLSQRVDLCLMDEQPERTDKQYRSTTTGRLRNLRSTTDWNQKYQTQDFDDPTHRAMTAWLSMDQIQINGRDVTLKTMYRILTDVRRNVAHGEFEVYEEAYSRISRFGN